jgi:hypothetical protein
VYNLFKIVEHVVDKILIYVKVKTPDDGHMNCPKHVEFHSKHTFEKLVHLVGLIIRTSLKWLYNIGLIMTVMSETSSQ